MSSKELRKYKCWAREHGLPRISNYWMCESCIWFSKEYPKCYCLKWCIHKNPGDIACSYLRRESKMRINLVWWLSENYRDYSEIEFNYVLAKNMFKQLFEDYAYVLDVKKPDKENNECSILLLLGTKYFTLMEATTTYDKYNIGMIHKILSIIDCKKYHIKRRIRY